MLQRLSIRGRRLTFPTNSADILMTMRHNRLSQLCWFAIMTCLALPVHAADNGFKPGWTAQQADPRTTYERLAPAAYAGDAETQNFLGYMFFHGEGVERDIEMSHLFFHLAAEQGHRGAQKNLSVLHSGSLTQVPSDFRNLEEALCWFLLAGPAAQLPSSAEPTVCTTGDCSSACAQQTQLPQPGQSGPDVYLTFCAGCHQNTGGLPPGREPQWLEQATSVAQSHREISETIGSVFFDAALRHGESLDQSTTTSAQPFQAENRLNSMAFDEGKSLFTTFCSGCHGFNGIAYFVLSPSFALGERMEKSDIELLRSIANGRGAMPGWSGKLSPLQIRRVLAYIRGLRSSYERGISASLVTNPSLFFIFRPSRDIDPLSQTPLPLNLVP